MSDESDFQDDPLTDMRGNGYPSSVHDWMRAIRRPTPYRVGNARLHIKPRTVAYATLFTAAVLTLFICLYPSRKVRSCPNTIQYISSVKDVQNDYDSKYPLTNPLKLEYGLIQYKIALVTDLDTDSKSKTDKNTWISYLLHGNLTVSDDNGFIDVKFSKQPRLLKSKLSQGGRGMELSELVVFSGKLYTVDDRTGVIYQIKDGEVFPWVILADGNGNTAKGFKCEWATVKGGRLYVGGLGKEWTTVDGEVQNYNPQWIKSIGPHGDVKHLNWHNFYDEMRVKTGNVFPGYIIHESGVWSDVHQRWFFLPRRASKQKYEETADEKRATNLMIIADENFTNLEVRYVGQISPTRGFSSFKFIPQTNDQVIVALKSEEDAGTIASYILAFDIKGKIIMQEHKIGNYKYEGIEFI
ncbi:hypothetical protein KUTeg_002965 [Tegillarca granosa]|uniref:Soluble calcium-activated nucleotidase 1 n=1 Tax=Tegillarca granosa TaxID=220873 RepID=A0ABQ9FKR0_TEGGR|nr:hypothetical protein KUTeg_002965 [Tegillarca granosa]